MTTIHPLLAKLSRSDPDTDIVELIQSILASCKDIRSVSRIESLEDGMSRSFIIDTLYESSVNSVINLLGGGGNNCRVFAITAVLLRIPD